MTETTLVTTAADMAAILYAASPAGAPGLALDGHELACEAGDAVCAQFWLDVRHALGEPALAAAVPAVPSPTGYRSAVYGPHRTVAPERRRVECRAG